MGSIAFSTIKGGVRKTTLRARVASALVDAGHSVLLLDLDPQAHSSLVLGLDGREGPCAAEMRSARGRSAGWTNAWGFVGSA
ncbi:ParA family protein [Myxococcus sp. RHSTA-1-4]|uniref:ParA family protein n=1 Tax=Myxococcus sp. RHSTA-1-4 TaxID=2874601 RepID=UPI001CBE3150|nr:ParA family protein [Myxococcus sp. RHSTA-1-4]